MANPKFYPGDLAPITYTMGSGSENPTYPLSNLKTYDPRDYWLGPGPDTTDFNLNINLGAVPSGNVTGLVLDNVNLSGFGQNMYIRLQSDNNDNGAYSAVTDHLILGAMDFNNYDPFAWSFTGATKRYWRLQWDKNADSFQPKLGQAFLRKEYDFGAYELPAKVKNERFIVGKGEALDGTIRRTNLFTGRYTWELEFKLLSDTQKASFWQFLQKIVGPGYGFYYKDPSGKIFYCYMDLDYMPITERMYNINDVAAIKFSQFLPSSLVNPISW